jgi:peptidoglycan/LPS O-acetylase OafA/YrhL
VTPPHWRALGAARYRVAATRGSPPAAGHRASSGGRVAGIEGLRAIAASSIVVYHVWVYSTPDGRVDAGYLSRFALPHLPAGVTLFFALSGYLLYRPIAASVLATGRVPSVRKYLRNRALRILPAYWVILAATAVVLPAALLRLSRSELVLGRLVERPDLLLGNALLAQNYRPASLDTGIGPTWSLAVEVVFYLTLPVLGVLAAVCFRRARSSRSQVLALLVAPTALLLLGVLGKAASTWLPAGRVYPAHDILSRSFLANADLFAPGMALAVLHVLVRNGRVRLPRHWAAAVWALLAADVVAVVLLTDRGVLWRWGVANPYQRLTALACVLLVALVVLPSSAVRPPPLVRALDWRPLFLCGLASYSLFLWHEPITRLLAAEGLTAGGRVGLVVNLGVVALVAGLLATATYRFVERPALARKANSTGPHRNSRSPARSGVTIGGLADLTVATPAADDVTSGRTRLDLAGGDEGDSASGHAKPGGSS